MKIEILKILENVKHSKIEINDAFNDILNILKINKSEMLKSGDDLTEYGETHRKDCETIKNVLINKGFINAGLNDALSLWCQYSDDYAAGRLGLPDNEDKIYNCIKYHINKTIYPL